jgi:uncharacterized protein YacL
MKPHIWEIQTGGVANLKRMGFFIGLFVAYTMIQPLSHRIKQWPIKTTLLLLIKCCFFCCWLNSYPLTSKQTIYELIMIIPARTTGTKI